MIHPHGYWLEISKENEHVCDTRLCESILKTFNVKNAIDIGCGNGSYVFAFKNNGIECEGWDGNPNTEELTGGLCSSLDFAQPQSIGVYDLVLSLEVGEHIPKDFEQIFIDNICRASHEWICLSWGIIGQPGYGHVNCQDNNYIICEFEKRGFKYNKRKSDYLRKNCNFEWFKHSVMVFHYGLEE